MAKWTTASLQRAWSFWHQAERSEVLAEQVALMRRSFPVTLWASLATSVGALWVMSLVAPLDVMLWWLVSHVLVLGGVYVALRPLPRPQVAPEHDVARLMACMVAMGLTWGSLGCVVWWSSASREGVIYTIGILSTVSSGALGLGAPLLRGYIAYLGCVMGGVSLAMGMAGGDVMLPAFALLAVYFALTCTHAYNLAQAARSSIWLKFDNQRLVAELRAQSHQARQAQDLAEQANQDKSRFLAAASHDLRQPLHAIGLFLEALQRSPLNTHQTLVLNHAQSASAATAEMLSTLLDYSRLEAGVIHARHVPFAIQPMLQLLEQEFGVEADGKNLVYRTRETSAAAFADRALVDLVMRNLISNALRYTHRGGVVIACRQRGTRLALEVWDTGIGIAPEHQETIFKEFHQIGNSERDRRKGLGLGLAIVKRLASELGTQVQVRSRPGRGSVFCLWLDRWQGALLPDETPLTSDSAALAHLRIWVVDDDETVCLAMQALLQSWGCLCRTASSAAGVLQQLLCPPLATEGDWAAASPPDLIITDFRLRDDQTGKQVLHTLRTHWQQDIAAIILTGDTSPQRLRDAQSTAALLLHKPVPSGVLREAMVALMPKAERTAQAAMSS